MMIDAITLDSDVDSFLLHPISKRCCIDIVIILSRFELARSQIILERIDQSFVGEICHVL
ncbi:MAG: hypothetical protein H6766_00610 [Candidatus Peribacteria bacterium]|nr:MAG: hypothetical protein H6766_00610 [Candidatus Peribacteria bacterium]